MIPEVEKRSIHRFDCTSVSSFGYISKNSSDIIMTNVEICIWETNVHNICMRSVQAQE